MARSGVRNYREDWRVEALREELDLSSLRLCWIRRSHPREQAQRLPAGNACQDMGRRHWSFGPSDGDSGNSWNRRDAEKMEGGRTANDWKKDGWNDVQPSVPRVHDRTWALGQRSRRERRPPAGNIPLRRRQYKLQPPAARR